MTKYIAIFFIFLLGFNKSFAQENKLPTNFSEYCLYADTQDPIKTQQYLKYDFSNSLIPEKGEYYQFLGVIGQHYQRLYIIFDNITKDKNDQRIYLVNGHSKVKGNKNDFSGKIIIEKIYASESEPVLATDLVVEDTSKAGVTVFAKYEFFEDKNQKFSGRFKGEMWLSGYINMKDNFVYGGSHEVCPSYRNNQYVGSWQEYKTSKIKIANWGQHQIPGVSERDDPTGGGTSCGGFGVDPKYYSRGWSEKEQPPKC